MNYSNGNEKVYTNKLLADLANTLPPLTVPSPRQGEGGVGGLLTPFSISINL